MKHKNTILIVEDEKIPAAFLEEILEENGFIVVGICDSGADAVKKAVQLKPDIIFMDIMLKDNMSGCEAALKIASLTVSKIIFLTAHSEAEMIEYALDANAVNYLIKPYKEEQILATLKVALRKENRDCHKLTQVHLKHGYIYDLHKQKLFLNKRRIDIGIKSMLLLDYMCSHAGKVLSKGELSHCIYGGYGKEGTLRTLISRLNKTVGYELIEHQKNKGYTVASNML